MKELLTVQEFAEAAGKSKQAVYKALNNKLNPFVQLVDGKKMIHSKALFDVYGVTVDQPGGASGDNQSQPMDALIAMLQKELDAKNEQIAAQQRQLEAKDRQIEQLTLAIENTTSSLQTAQALHAGTLQKQLQTPTPEDLEDTTEEPKKKKGWFHRFGKE